MKKLEPLHIAGGNENSIAHLENNLIRSQKLKIQLPGPAPWHSG